MDKEKSATVVGNTKKAEGTGCFIQDGKKFKIVSAPLKNIYNKRNLCIQMLFKHVHSLIVKECFQSNSPVEKLSVWDICSCKESTVKVDHVC